MVLKSLQLQRMCFVTICRCPREISRQLEPLERIYGCFPSAYPVASLVDYPTLERIYIERNRWNLNSTKSLQNDPRTTQDTKSTTKKLRWEVSIENGC